MHFVVTAKDRTHFGLLGWIPRKNGAERVDTD